MGRQSKYARSEVLEKAMELFWAKGYHATSLKDLENTLDMRPGSIYAAFGSKEGLFAEALQLYSSQSRGHLEQLLGQSNSPLMALADHVRRLGCNEAAEQPSRACMLVKTLLETPDEDPVLRKTTENLLEETETAFRKAFLIAREIGELGPGSDPVLLASRLQSEIMGLRSYAQRTDASDRVEALAEDIAKDIERLSTVNT